METPPFPIQLSSDEIESLEKDVEGPIRGMQLMGQLRRSLGDLWPVKELVTHE